MSLGKVLFLSVTFALLVGCAKSDSPLPNDPLRNFQEDVAQVILLAKFRTNASMNPTFQALFASLQTKGCVVTTSAVADEALTTCPIYFKTNQTNYVVGGAGCPITSTYKVYSQACGGTGSGDVTQMSSIDFAVTDSTYVSQMKFSSLQSTYRKFSAPGGATEGFDTTVVTSGAVAVRLKMNGVTSSTSKWTLDVAYPTQVTRIEGVRPSPSSAWTYAKYDKSSAYQDAAALENFTSSSALSEISSRTFVDPTCHAYGTTFACYR